MQFTLILLTLITSVMGARFFARDLIFDNDLCNADNCARQVTGTRKGAATVSAHSSDCSVFMTVTVESDGE